MGIRHLATLLPMAAPLAHSRGHPALERTLGLRNLQTGLFGAAEPEEAETTISAPTYDPEECDKWIEKLVASDDNKSGGLSGPEYYAFLSGIEDPPYIAEYFKGYGGFDELPWVFRVVHKSLACHCEQLGFGEGCCEGGKGEVLLEGLEDNGNGGAATNRVGGVYRDWFCQQIAHVLTKSIPTPAPTDGPTTKSPTSGPTPPPSTGPSAAPVTGVPTRAPSAGPTVFVAPTPSPSTPAPTPEPTDAPSVYFSAALPVPVVAVRNAEEEEDDDGSSGNNRGLVAVGSIVACLAVLVAALLLAARRRRANERDRLRKFAGNQAPEADLEVAPRERARGPEAAPDAGPPGWQPDEDDESSAPSDWSESDAEGAAEELHEGHEGPGQTAGSALAAMGAASTVTARIGSINGNLGNNQIV